MIGMKGPMRMTVEGTDQRPLAFDGESIAVASSRLFAGKERNRWHEIEVWKTTTNTFVVSVNYKTQWEGESDFDDVLAFETSKQVATFLEQYIFPNIASIGFAPTAADAEKQARMMADLKAGFKEAVGEIIKALGVVEAVGAFGLEPRSSTVQQISRRACV